MQVVVRERANTFVVIPLRKIVAVRRAAATMWLSCQQHCEWLQASAATTHAMLGLGRASF